MFNNVILVGRLVREPELRYTPNGVALAKFTLALDRPRANGQAEKETDFIDCVAWRQQAEHISNYGEKGRLMGVEGRLQVRKWDAPDGTRRRFYEVHIWRMRFLDKRSSAGTGEALDPVEPLSADISGVEDPFNNNEA